MMKIHYLEIVTDEVDKVCQSYSNTLNISFSDEIPELGMAKTSELPDGSLLGIRKPMHEAEEATTRPYYLVKDIDLAVINAEESGAIIAVPPMEISERGKCAIIMFGSIQSGFWQL